MGSEKLNPSLGGRELLRLSRLLRFKKNMKIEDFVRARNVSLIAGVFTKVRCMSRKQVEAELFQIVGLSMLVKPSTVAEVVLNRDFIFPDVTFR